MDRYLYIWTLLIGLMISPDLLAAKKPFHHVFDQSAKKYYITEGRFTGGESARPLNLIDVGFSQAEQGLRERLQFRFADQQGKPLTDKLGYTHVTVEKAQKRIVIDLSQVLRTSIDGEALAKILTPSKLIKNSLMTMDPEDSTTNVTLNLHHAENVTVYRKYAADKEPLLIIEIKRRSVKK